MQCAFKKKNENRLNQTCHHSKVIKSRMKIDNSCASIKMVYLSTCI